MDHSPYSLGCSGVCHCRLKNRRAADAPHKTLLVNGHANSTLPDATDKSEKSLHRNPHGMYGQQLQQTARGPALEAFCTHRAREETAPHAAILH